jgi:spermidine/putrescine-binding protein
MIGSGNVNAAAMPYIDDAVRNNRAVFPGPEGMKRLQMLKDYGRKERRLMNRLWTEIKVR